MIRLTESDKDIRTTFQSYSGGTIRLTEDTESYKDIGPPYRDPLNQIRTYDHLA